DQRHADPGHPGPWAVGQTYFPLFSALLAFPAPITFYDSGMATLSRHSFLDLVLDVQRDRFPLIRAQKDEATFALILNGNSASMENLYRTVIQDPDTARRQIERWLTELVRAGEGTRLEHAKFEEVRERIMPLV